MKKVANVFLIRTYLVSFSLEVLIHKRKLRERNSHGGCVRCTKNQNSAGDKFQYHLRFKVLSYRLDFSYEGAYFYEMVINQMYHFSLGTKTYIIGIQ